MARSLLCKSVKRNSKQPAKRPGQSRPACRAPRDGHEEVAGVQEESPLLRSPSSPGVTAPARSSLQAAGTLAVQGVPQPSAEACAESHLILSPHRSVTSEAEGESAHAGIVLETEHTEVRKVDAALLLEFSQLPGVHPEWG